MGVRYNILGDGLPFSEATPVAACSALYHGIDVLILRVTAHPRAPIVEWGEPGELKPGDELLIIPRKEIHPEPTSLRFIHLNLLEWTKARPADLPPQWRNVMVAEGLSKPGFSGSPWVRGGKVFGLHKGRVTPSGGRREFPVAETASKVRECLKVLAYEDLVPKE